MFLKWQSMEPPSSTPGGDRHIRRLTFCTKLHSEQFLIEEIFDAIPLFGRKYCDTYYHLSYSKIVKRN